MKRASRAAFAALLLSACFGDPAGIDQTLSVAGGELDVWCDGGEGPTIVFLAAIGGDDTLRPIAERFTGEANACFYFRPGDGETEPPDDARTSADDASDLHELLVMADLDTPAVLVAHSYGSFVALHTMQEHPEDVAAIVFVDGSVPAADEAFYALVTDEQRAILDAEYANFPYVDWHTSAAQAAADLETFPSVTTTMITATRSFVDPCNPELPCEALQDAWIAVQTEMADTIHAHQVLADTGHYVHVDDPDLVEREIRAILDRSGVTADPTPESG